MNINTPEDFRELVYILFNTATSGRVMQNHNTVTFSEKTSGPSNPSSSHNHSCTGLPTNTAQTSSLQFHEQKTTTVKATPACCYIQHSCAETVWCTIRRLHEERKLQKVNGTTKALVQQ